MKLKHEWLLWLLVLLGLSLVAALSWVLWGGHTPPLPERSPEQRFAVYIGTEECTERFSQLRTSPLLNQKVYCEAEPLLTAEHVAEIRREPTGETFGLWLEPTPAGKVILQQQADQYRQKYLVITVDGKELGAAKCWSALPALLLVPEALGYAEPSRRRMEEYQEYLEGVLFPANER